MFRNPRPAPVANGETPLTPSTGRPPTPPGTASSSAVTAVLTHTSPMASTSPPVLGRSRTVVKKTAQVGHGKTMAKSNGNIMSFFKPSVASKSSELSQENNEESLFVESSPLKAFEVATQIPTPPQDTSTANCEGVDTHNQVDSPLSRFNEDIGPNKRRKTQQSLERRQSPIEVETPIRKGGPFQDESEEEDEANAPQGPALNSAATKEKSASGSEIEIDNSNLRSTVAKESKMPSLNQESTSIGEVDEFDGVEDFIDDEFAEEGEEYMERKWMREQAELEVGLEEDDYGENTTPKPNQEETDLPAGASENDKAATACCPICCGSTIGLSDQQVSVHVNNCLDGKADPLPALGNTNEPKSEAEPEPSVPESQVPVHKRFNKAAIARPGQENPITLSSAPGDRSSSAFSKLMSGHAEDNAWAAAAASEASSRGKPAYQRTCPFYKIMPGFYICVDAFRYGAVQGCNAYFLSHFHSDHYIGLTSLWCHGPIYCSRVTANLVKRQLRVDPKWVVDLEFERKVEVPDTNGVEVTMIPANHCPGSSLFLFEKNTGKGKTPRVQRVLHCGDFRACPAHVQHSKLRPDILDNLTGQIAGQQKIDVCYLDTTYLTPKYAFPRQEQVIKACSDMCVSLSKDFVDEGDSWEQTKKERAGAGMVKFVRKSSIKEEDDAEDATKIKVEGSSEPFDKKSRGRLLVVVGTYSIGKERICLGVAKALNSKIYAPPNKLKVVAALEDPELSARMTNDPLDAQVHMQMLMEIRAETLADYLTGYKPHFTRVVGFRPTGWNYRPPNSRFTESPSVQTVLHSENWKSTYSMAELVPQRGSTRESNCFGVPYSEHSSFRELSMFCCALRIDRIIPTVNVGSAKSRERMKAWCEKWAMEKKKNGLYKVEDGQVEW